MIALQTWLRHSLQIARVERIRSQRQLDHSSTVRALIVLFVLGGAIGSGFAAYSFGMALRTGQVALSIEVLRAVMTAGFIALLVGFAQQTSKLVARLEIDLLRTAISTREIVLGLILAAASRTVARIALTMGGMAVGFALGAQLPSSILTICGAVAGLLVLAVLLGVSLSSAVQLVTTRSPWFRRYKSVFIVIVLAVFSVVLIIASTGKVSVDFVIRWLAAAPTAWFADLALLSVPGSRTGVFRSVGAIGMVAIGMPVLSVVATVLAERVWTTEPAIPTQSPQLRLVSGTGFVERVFAGRVSRPVLAVARKRWLQERRVPRSLMMPVYLLLLLPGVVLPALAAGEVPGISLLLLVFICAGSTGLAFGLDPIGTEYSSLPMTLTAVCGKQFVRGALLSGAVIGVPVTVVVIFLSTLCGSYGVTETLLFVVTGTGICVCSLSLSVAFGMESSHSDIFPAPLPLTSATIYTEIGAGGFIRIGLLIGLLGIVCLPAFGSYLIAFFSLPSVGSIPMALIQIGSLVLTTVFAASVSLIAYRRAVRLYDDYTLS